MRHRGAARSGGGVVGLCAVSDDRRAGTRCAVGVAASRLPRPAAAAARGGASGGGVARAGAGRLRRDAVAPAAPWARWCGGAARGRAGGVRRRGAVGAGFRGRPSRPRRGECRRRRRSPPSAGMGIRRLQLRRRGGPGELLRGAAGRRDRDRGEPRGGATEAPGLGLLPLGTRQSRPCRGGARGGSAVAGIRLRRAAASGSAVSRALPVGSVPPPAGRFRAVRRGLRYDRRLCVSAAAGGTPPRPTQRDRAGRSRIRGPA